MSVINGFVMNMVCYERVTSERCLLWTTLLQTWSVMNRSIMYGFVMNMVCYEHGLSRTWPVMDLVCHEHGLLLSWFVTKRSIMNLGCC